MSSEHGYTLVYSQVLHDYNCKIIGYPKYRYHKNHHTCTHLFVSLKVALVTGGVVAAATDVVLLTAVDCQMTLEQRLAAEVSSAMSTLVAGSVEDEDVISERRLALEHDRTALQLLVRLVVHRRDVTLEVVLAVGEVATLWTAEQPLGSCRRQRGKPRRWPGQSRRVKNV